MEPEELQPERWFPCPICKEPLEVRTSKKGKPYVVCNTCGMQMFIRKRAGIEAFEVLVGIYGANDLQRELDYLVERYTQE